MEKERVQEVKRWVQQELKASIKFWLENGMDREHGGIYTCLDRKGRLYSSDKSVWMQGRCAWSFSYLCKTYGQRPEWLEAAESCLDFLERYCINYQAGGRLYFQVTAEGKPIRQRRYCFSEGFYAIANAEYYGVTRKKEYLERARRAYQLVYELNNGLIEDPTGMGPKCIPETRKGRALADPMIFLNITSVLRRVDPDNKQKYDQYAAECTQAVLDFHYKPKLGCTLETVGEEGEFWQDISIGRLVNPGHDIECSWFLMEYANYLKGEKGQEIYQKAEEIFTLATQKGWDQKFGGLLYFIDCLGNPPEAYEHDMKLWWPHTELMIASLMAYRDTGKEDYWDWFDKAVQYCQEYFCDEDFGEWYGYLHRDGTPTLPAAKGSTFKGPFHVLRALIMVDQMLDEIFD